MRAEAERSSDAGAVADAGKVFLLAIALALVVAPTIGLELALVAGAVIVAFGIWKLAVARVRPPKRASQ